MYLIWNLFFALLLWKGIEGNKTAQYIFICSNWLSVVVLFFATHIIKKVDFLKVEVTNAKKVTQWITIPIAIGFFTALIWYGWIWTSVAIILEFVFVDEFKTACLKKLDKSS
jgi:hypothetical protein